MIASYPRTTCIQTIIMTILGPLLLKSIAPGYCTLVSASFDSQDVPRSMTLHAAVLTDTVPLAYYEDDHLSNKHEIFPQYRGFQPDLLRQLQIIAKTLDNVTLMFELEQAPAFSYVEQFEYVANDCNTTRNVSTRTVVLSEQDCQRFDFIVGDFYAYPARFLRSVFTPPLLTTAAATVKHSLRDKHKRPVTTLEEARVLQESVCLLKASHYDDQTIERFPGINVTWCYSHVQCIALLKQDRCVLFVEDELQLRYLAAQDAELEVTREHFDAQYIVWPLNERHMDPVWQRLFIRWIYEAKVNGFLDQLYNQYFSPRYCPLGLAGKHCNLPCSPSTGLADRYGTCICDSTKWTGADCSIEVAEDKHLISPALSIACYLMIAINFSMVAGCAIWMWRYRKTVQVSVAQPFFLGLVLLGCLVSTSTIFALGVEDEGDGTVPACMTIPWLYSVGFSITFGTLFAKIRRVYRLFKAAAHMQRAAVSVKDTMLVIGAILLVDVGILTAWTLFDPLEWVRSVLIVDKYGNALSSEGHCTSEYWGAFAGTIAVLHFSLMAVACWLAYVSRDVPTEFSEGKYVTIAVLSNLQIFMVGIPVLIIVGNSSETSFFIRSMIVWMNDFVVVVLIFGNLMYHVHWDRRRSSQSTSRASFIRHAMDDYVNSSNSRVAPAAFVSSPLSINGDVQPGLECINERFSTYDGTDATKQRPPPLISDPIEERTTEETAVNQPSSNELAAAGAMPSVLMTFSESGPRLHVDAGNGQTSTVPITKVCFDATTSSLEEC